MGAHNDLKDKRATPLCALRGGGWVAYSESAARRHLLKRLAIVFHPTRDVPPFRIMVCPMDDPTFRTPDIFAVKADTVAFLESVNSRGDVDVVCHEQCLSRRKTNHESLVSRHFQIVRQNTNHDALAFDLYVAGPTLERMTEGVILGYRCRTAFSRPTLTTTRDGGEGEECTGRNDENHLDRGPTGLSSTTVVLSFPTIREVCDGVHR